MPIRVDLQFGRSADVNAPAIQKYATAATTDKHFVMSEIKEKRLVEVRRSCRVNKPANWLESRDRIRHPVERFDNPELIFPSAATSVFLCQNSVMRIGIAQDLNDILFNLFIKSKPTIKS